MIKKNCHELSRSLRNKLYNHRIRLRRLTVAEVHWCCGYTGTAMRVHSRVKKPQIEDTVGDVLRNASHRPGGTKFRKNSFEFC